MRNIVLFWTNFQRDWRFIHLTFPVEVAIIIIFDKCPKWLYSAVWNKTTNEYLTIVRSLHILHLIIFKIFENLSTEFWKSHNKKAVSMFIFVTHTFFMIYRVSCSKIFKKHNQISAQLEIHWKSTIYIKTCQLEKYLLVLPIYLYYKYYITKLTCNRQEYNSKGLV